MKGFYYETKLGKLFIAEDGQGIAEVSIVKNAMSPDDKNTTGRKELTSCEIEETPLIRQAIRELMEYFDGKRKEFGISLNPKGTDFQKKVWEALRAIPYGETRSYKQIAEAVGNRNSSRAVGMANHNNPIMCIIPCHRVIGANGSLVGYAGGLDMKATLLSLEQKNRSN
jgi:methylated-DNA-[protein]-cysteine S-methyltransferase